MRRIALVGIAIVLAIVLVAWKACGGSSKQDSAASHGGATGPAIGAVHKDRKGPTQPASISGRVTRKQDGAGVAGAIVSLTPAELMAMFIKSEAPTLVAVTDANGNWTAPRVMPGAYVIAATASGYLPGEHGKLTVGSGEQKKGIDITLAQGGTIVRGTVTDVGGGPIADARISATKGEIPDLSGHSELIATSNGDGKYELTLPDGDFSLEATHDEYTSASERIEVAGAPLTVDFSLIPGAVVRGQVVARDSGNPVPGALVRAEGAGRGRGGDNGGTTVTDESGNFVLRSLPGGTLELHALARGFATQTPTIVSVGIGEQVEGVRVLVDGAYSIRGTVVRKGGDKPIPGITLGAFSIASKSFGLALEPSAEDGSFEIVGLKPASYMLFAVGEGSVPDVGKQVDVKDKDVEGVKVELSVGATLAGRVEPPMAGAAISAQLAGAVGITNMFDAAKLVLVHGETDESGAFTLKNVPAGSLKLSAVAPDGHTGELPITVAETDQSGLVIKLEARATVSGRVIDTSGKPVASARVRADSDSDKPMSFSFSPSRSGSTTSKPDGTFKIVGLEAGKTRVNASGGDDEYVTWTKADDDKLKSQATLDLVAGKEVTGVTLTIEAHDGVIKGQVLGPDHKPAADAWVRANRRFEMDPKVKEAMKKAGLDDDDDENGPSRRGWPAGPPVLTNADGQFSIGKLRKGTYDLTVEGPRGASHAEKTGVKTGDSVTIQLLSLGTMTGKVTVGGKPVTVYDIDCDGPSDNAEKHVTADDGSYTLDRLAPGTYKCNVSGDAGTAQVTKIEVPAGPVTQDFALTRWATITGVVVNVLTKQPIAGAHAVAGGSMFGAQNFNDMLTGKSPTTDANGRFMINRVAVGKGSVAIMPKDGFTPLGQRDYTATEGQTVDVGTIEVIPPREGEAGTFGFATEVKDKDLVVASVKGGGPAEAAGMQVGDVITSINGKTVDSLTPPIAALLLASGTPEIGQTIQLDMQRGGSPVTATVTSVKW